MNKKAKLDFIFIITYIMLLIVFLTFLYPALHYIDCHGDKWFTNGEIYYYKNYDGWEYPYSCDEGNRTQDILNRIEWAKQNEINNNISAEREKCYNAGYDEHLQFDLINDYNFTCKKISYLNDHFILGAEQKNGGTVSFSSNTFFTSNDIKVQLYDWVNIEYVATGLLAKNITYHIDCQNSTETIINTMNIIYYSESDFIMYYTNNCI